MTSSQAAERLGISARTVRRHAARGLLLGARREGRDWHIPSDAVQAEQARRARHQEASA
ncbi:helix-turn-helix domain-containing protein [Streptomyces sp. ID05-26A]|nr:helix-turn-helix domain-containing protein [Streptomyces sp. ID05-26A]